MNIHLPHQLTKITAHVVLTASLLIASLPLHAQDPVRPRPSPLAIVSARYKDAYLKITCSQPHKRGREVFGKLVPFGKVWRTGANEATEITLTRDMEMNGAVLAAGTYSLFTIPGKEQWTIIINTEPGLWGSYNYNEALDTMRFEVPVERVEGDVVYEAFTIEIRHKNDVADLLLIWDRTRVRIPLKFIEIQ